MVNYAISTVEWTVQPELIYIHRSSFQIADNYCTMLSLTSRRNRSNINVHGSQQMVFVSFPGFNGINRDNPWYHIIMKRFVHGSSIIHHSATLTENNKFSLGFKKYIVWHKWIVWLLCISFKRPCPYSHRCNIVNLIWKEVMLPKYTSRCSSFEIPIIWKKHKSIPFSIYVHSYLNRHQRYYSVANKCYVNNITFAYRN